MRKTHVALLLGLAVVASAGVAGAAYAGQSIWGDANPGLGMEHAALSDAGAEHNQAGAVHPPDSAGKPDDVPPEDAGMPAELPEQASDEAGEHYPPSTPG